MKSAANIPNGSYYALITAKVFTAFMFEGVVNHLGEKLCSTWNKSDPSPKKALARQPLTERHKKVRRFLQLDNSGRQYEDISVLVDRLLKFRDSFAHPKICQQIIQDSVRTEFAAIPSIEWETEIEAAKIECDYQEIEKYAIYLLDTAAACLENTFAQGWDAWQQAYPHLGDLRLEAAYLRGFLHSPAHSSTDFSV